MSNSPRSRDEESERLLTVAEAASALNVSEKFVRRLIFDKRIPYVKLGRAVRIEPSALRTLVRASRVPPR